MWDRRSLPTVSTCEPACSSRIFLKCSWPARFSAIHSRANVAVLDLAEDLLHLGPDVVVDDARAARVVAVLGRVGDREAHALQALLVHQVDDQLELVQALEVGHLGVVARLDERLEAGLDERRGAAAEHGLLAEQVGLGLLVEASCRRRRRGCRRCPWRRPARASLACAARVLVDGDERRDAGALEVLAAHEVAGALGGDERDVDVRRAARSRRSGSRSRGRRAAGCRRRRRRLTCSFQMSRWRSSGTSIITMSPREAASAGSSTSKPASLAALTESESERSPTTTSTPESLRFCAWAWPCEPKPMIATVLPSRRERSASSS